MTETLQLMSFLLSFSYGVFFGIFTCVHFRLTKSFALVWQYLTTLFFVIDIVLGYLFCMYQLNEGIFHIYFLGFVFGGFFLSFPLQKYVKSCWQRWKSSRK